MSTCLIFFGGHVDAKKFRTQIIPRAKTSIKKFLGAIKIFAAKFVGYFVNNLPADISASNASTIFCAAVSIALA